MNKDLKNKIANIIYCLIFDYSKKTNKQTEKDFGKAVEDTYILLDNCRSLQKQELLKEIENLIVEEMLICHKENQPTSRLTSLLSKLKQTLTK